MSGDDRRLRRTTAVWRVGAGRLLVRRIGVRDETAAAELHGVAALAWLHLESALTLDELHAACGSTPDTVRAVVSQLRDVGLVEATIA